MLASSRAVQRPPKLTKPAYLLLPLLELPLVDLLPFSLVSYAVLDYFLTSNELHSTPCHHLLTGAPWTVICLVIMCSFH